MDLMTILGFVLALVALILGSILKGAGLKGLIGGAARKGFRHANGSQKTRDKSTDGNGQGFREPREPLSTKRRVTGEVTKPETRRDCRGGHLPQSRVRVGS